MAACFPPSAFVSMASRPLDVVDPIDSGIDDGPTAYGTGKALRV